MLVDVFLNTLGSVFYTGVPDSLLSPLTDYLMDMYGEDNSHHIIAANEGNAVGVAAGYYLSTGKVPIVYLQNSGEGNIVNPIASLINKHVFGIPVIFIIGWRGAPDTKDEPQHSFQGVITERLLKDLEIEYCVVSNNTTVVEVERIMSGFKSVLENGQQVAFIIKEGALTNFYKKHYRNDYELKREDILRDILIYSNNDIVIATTGKTSREIYELRESMGDSHARDFLTIGSMGHASSIALGISVQKPDIRVWCIDGDAAALMHLGSLSIISNTSPENLIHVVINNKSHESVGGLPTAASKGIFYKIARDVGYNDSYLIENRNELINILEKKDTLKGPVMIEIMSKIGSRLNLGRPSTAPADNKYEFMKYIESYDA